MNKIIAMDWDANWVEEHRRGICDLGWASMQPDGPPSFMLGDVVEFMAGGVGVITGVKPPHNGWPSSYSTSSIEGFPYHSTDKAAWHYEGDFKSLVEPSAIRKVTAQDKNKEGE